MRVEDLIRSIEHSYLYFNRVDRYLDFPNADPHDGEQLVSDLDANRRMHFDRDPAFNLSDYYNRARSRSYACCFSLENSDHIWAEYGNHGQHGKVCLEVDFDKLRARLNATLQAGACRLLAGDIPCLQIFSLNYGKIDYVDRATHRESLTRYANPIRYTYVKDLAYAPEKEMRISLSAIGMGQFTLADGTLLPFSPSLQAQFDFKAAYSDGIITQLMIAEATDLDYLTNELHRLGISRIDPDSLDP